MNLHIAILTPTRPNFTCLRHNKNQKNCVGLKYGYTIWRQVAQTNNVRCTSPPQGDRQSAGNITGTVWISRGQLLFSTVTLVKSPGELSELTRKLPYSIKPVALGPQIAAGTCPIITSYAKVCGFPFFAPFDPTVVKTIKV